MKTYTFERAWGEWTNGYAELCGRGITSWADVPETAKKLYITISGHPSKEAYKYRLTEFIDTTYAPDLALLTKKGNWEDPASVDLESYARDDNWPKTGYIKVEYSE